MTSNRASHFGTYIRYYYTGPCGAVGLADQPLPRARARVGAHRLRPLTANAPQVTARPFGSGTFGRLGVFADPLPP